MKRVTLGILPLPFPGTIPPTTPPPASIPANPVTIWDRLNNDWPYLLGLAGAAVAAFFVYKRIAR